MAQVPAKFLNATAEARKLLAQGDPKAAIRLAEPVTQAVPGLVGAQTVLARAHTKLGETDKALARYRAAAEASRGDPERWKEFVVELLKAGQKSRARNAAQKAPLKGRIRKALIDLAKTGIWRGGAALGGVDQVDIQTVQNLMRRGRLKDARERGEALIAKHPESAFVYNLLGLIALADDRLDDAAACFRETLRLSPIFSGAAANLGFTLTRQEQFGEAISVLRDAVASDPKAVDVRTNLASAYLEAGFVNDAVKQAEKLLGLSPDNPNAIHMMAHGLVKAGRHTDALTYIERVMASRDGPDIQVLMFEALAGSGQENAALDFAASLGAMREDLHLKYAELLAELGRFTDARSELEKIITANPDNHFAYYRYGTFAIWKEDDPLLPRLRDITNPETAVSRPQKSSFAFYARAKAETDLKNDRLVFPALDEANRLQSQGIYFDALRYEAHADSVTGVWTADAMDSLSGVGATGVRPIFVVGMPRSGSTLVDRILAAHADVASVGEDSVLDKIFPFDMQAQSEAVSSAANEGIAAMAEHVGRSSRYLDKYLANFLRVGMFAAAYPHAVFIWSRRDPRSIALSIYSNAMKAKSHPYSMSLEGIAAFYLHCERLMKHWQELLGDRIVEVCYEDLVSDPEPTIRALVDRVGLPWDDACLNPEVVTGRVKTLSIRQARTEINKGSLEKWRRFEAELQPFVRALERQETR